MVIDILLYTERVSCKIFEPLQVQPFAQSVSYGFKGTCEHVALSLCEGSSSASIRFGVTVDFLTESMENGAVGLFVNNSHWISREDSSFDDGNLEPQTSQIANDVTRHTYIAGVVVELYSNQTIITFSASNIEVVITHNHGKNHVCFTNGHNLVGHIIILFYC